MTVEANCIVVKCTDQVCTEVDGEVMMMNVDKGNFYGLDSVGSRIWTLISEPRQVGEICDALLSEYNVDRATCEADVLRFLNDMEAHGLIVTRSA